MSARSELGRIIWETSRRDEATISVTGADIVADAIRAAGYRKPRVITEWAAAHAENGAVYNVYRTRDEAQAFADSMAEVGHAMFIKRREHMPAVTSSWERAE